MTNQEVLIMSDVFDPQIGKLFLLNTPTPYGGFTAQEQVQVVNVFSFSKTDKVFYTIQSRTDLKKIGTFSYTPNIDNSI